MPAKTAEQGRAERGGPEPGGVAQWFNAEGDRARLLGSRCEKCGVFYFPPNLLYCRNPDCDSDRLKSLELSSRGSLWSFSKQHYPPPPPFRAPKNPEDFQPYIIAAVEMEEEKMIVLGHLARGVTEAELKLGMPMSLTVEPLQEAQGEILTWKWRPEEN